MGMAARVTKAITVAAMFILGEERKSAAGGIGILGVRQAMVVPLALAMDKARSRWQQPPPR